MKISLNDVKSYNTIKDLLLYIICSTITKVQMLNKPYIHHIDVKIMNNHWTDIYKTAGQPLNCSYNDMFIKMLI